MIPSGRSFLWMVGRGLTSTDVHPVSYGNQACGSFVGRQQSNGLAVELAIELRPGGRFAGRRRCRRQQHFVAQAFVCLAFCCLLVLFLHILLLIHHIINLIYK
jgi:hypothetical protein